MMAEEELDSFTKDALYADSHREELARQYPEQWVGIYHERVVGAAKTSKQLVRRLDKQGIPPGETYFHYASEYEPVLIVLAA